MATANPSDICIVVLLGLPAAGKTTFSQQCISSFSKIQYNVVHICYDNFVDLKEQAKYAESADSDEQESKWKEKRKEISGAVELFIEHVSEKSSARKCPNSSFCEKMLKDYQTFSEFNWPLVVLIDDNCYYSSMRYEYHQIARKFKTGFCQFTLEIQLNEALQRNQQREHKVPCDVIRNMAKKFEAPNPMANTWERFSFAVKCDRECFPTEMCQSVVDLARANPVLPVPERVTEEQRNRSRAACSASVIHQVDKLLRKKLNSTILEKKKNSVVLSKDKNMMQDYCKQLNSVRNEILEDLKTGFEKLPVEVIKGVENKIPGALDSLNLIVDQLFALKLKA